MKPRDRALRELVGQWIAKAEEDYQAASALLHSSPHLGAVICFHAQQAAEKYLKALLVSRQVRFPRTHDITELLDLLATIHPDVAASLQTASQLTPYGVVVRYPGNLPDIRPGEPQTAVTLARLVRDAIRTRLEI